MVRTPATRPSGLLLHFTNSRPKLPLLSSLEVNLFSSAVHGESGHRSMVTGPYWGHEGREAEVELDISSRRRRRSRGVAPLVAGEEEAEDEWVLSLLQNKHQKKGEAQPSSLADRLSRIAPRSNDAESSM